MHGLWLSLCNLYRNMVANSVFYPGISSKGLLMLIAIMKLDGYKSFQSWMWVTLQCLKPNMFNFNK